MPTATPILKLVLRLVLVLVLVLVLRLRPPAVVVEAGAAAGVPAAELVAVAAEA
jgi:hypothetical protein